MFFRISSNNLWSAGFYFDFALAGCEFSLFCGISASCSVYSLIRHGTPFLRMRFWSRPSCLAFFFCYRYFFRLNDLTTSFFCVFVCLCFSLVLSVGDYLRLLGDALPDLAVIDLLVSIPSDFPVALNGELDVFKADFTVYPLLMMEFLLPTAILKLGCFEDARAVYSY